MPRAIVEIKWDDVYPNCLSIWCQKMSSLWMWSCFMTIVKTSWRLQHNETIDGVRKSTAEIFTSIYLPVFVSHFQKIDWDISKRSLTWNYFLHCTDLHIHLKLCITVLTCLSTVGSTVQPPKHPDHRNTNWHKSMWENSQSIFIVLTLEFLLLGNVSS